MKSDGPVLHLICGKIAAGKSTLAAALSEQSGGVCLVQDDWLSGLYGPEMKTVADFVVYSERLERVMGPHVVGLLRAGVSVVLDFPANTVAQRRWMREVLDQSGAAHQLHVLDVPDEVCLARLKSRNASGTHAFTVSPEQFAQVTRHFDPPTPAEGFNIVMHDYFH